QGQRFEVEGEQQLRELYGRRFAGRKGFDHENAGKEGGLPGKPGNVSQPGELRSMAQDQPPSPGPSVGKDPAGLKAQTPDAGQKADKMSAQMVAHGLDPHLAASHAARGVDPLKGQKVQATPADAARIIDAAQFVARKQQEEQEQQARLAKI